MKLYNWFFFLKNNILIFFISYSFCVCFILFLCLFTVLFIPNALFENKNANWRIS